MKTPENSWADPSAQELVQRHRIYSAPSVDHTQPATTPNRRRLFTTSSATGKLNSSIPGVSMLAREHVGSLHQSCDTQLLFGKNNVMLPIVSTISTISFFSFRTFGSVNFFLFLVPKIFSSRKFSFAALKNYDEEFCFKINF